MRIWKKNYFIRTWRNIHVQFIYILIHFCTFNLSAKNHDSHNYFNRGVEWYDDTWIPEGYVYTIDSNHICYDTEYLYWALSFHIGKYVFFFILWVAHTSIIIRKTLFVSISMNIYVKSITLYTIEIFVICIMHTGEPKGVIYAMDIFILFILCSFNVADIVE